MAGIPKKWQLGSSVTGKAIIGQTLQTDNTFVAGTTYSLEYILERFGFSFQNQTEQIMGMDVNLDNQVIVVKSNSIVLEEIIQAAVQPRLELIAEGFDYASFIYTEFGKTKTIYGVVLGGGEEKARGKNMYRLELGPINLNNAGTPISNYASA